MILPIDIYKVLNDKKHFDVLFLRELKDNKAQEAYDIVLEKIRKFAPHFKHYADYKSYYSNCSSRGVGAIGSDKNVPDEIVYAVTKNIDKLMHKHLVRVKVRKMAYDATVNEINRYFPDYKPFRNYQSFKSNESIKHKKRKLKKIPK